MARSPETLRATARTMAGSWRRGDPMNTRAIERAGRSMVGLLLLLGGLACCGGGSLVSDAAVPACTWSPTLAADGSATGQCRAARLALSCRGSNGDGLLCLSESPAECPGFNPTPGVTYSDCADQCRPDEYAVACGGPGVAPGPEPPAGCRTVLLTPGGVTFSCCPCGL